MSHPVLATMVAVPALVMAVFVAYQVGDYLDPEVPNRAVHHGFREVRAEASIEQKVGRGIKQGAIGTGVLVAIPLAAFVGLVLYLMSNNKGGSRGDNYYGD